MHFSECNASKYKLKYSLETNVIILINKRQNGERDLLPELKRTSIF